MEPAKAPSPSNDNKSSLRNAIREAAQAVDAWLDSSPNVLGGGPSAATWMRPVESRLVAAHLAGEFDLREEILNLDVNDSSLSITARSYYRRILENALRTADPSVNLPAPRPEPTSTLQAIREIFSGAEPRLPFSRGNSMPTPISQWPRRQ